MKTILVPTDLSPMTDIALSVAVNLARTNGGEIILLHSVIYPMPVPTPVYAEALTVVTENTLSTYRLLEEDAREILEQLATNPAYAGVTITPTLITNGQPLVDNVTTRPADLIVMSSKGADGLEEWLIGSNAEVIVRYAHCPVLVVKHATPHFQPQNIVCAIDLDDRLKSIYHFPFQMGENGLHQFLYVMTPSDNRDPEGVREWVDEFADAKGITAFEFVIHHAKTVPQGVIDYANDVEADLIVLFTHGHKGFLHLLTGSVAEDVLNHTQIPVLVMRAG
ncbi:universal stress protein [Spirosoma fluviale]|uniref:Nucleotide-binding universal stress protein, UspA family n=1 Tax=Spirosoma fluviale TaxID=1597977 RepID=A0A286GDS5_9BACT|nr:universal stress protein [Spirosoma fluviale]SOD93396.1 Nucleotide-binding universal stress protein, UspA family [Spirosoma fluviale]